MIRLVKIVFLFLFMTLIFSCGKTPTSVNNEDRTPPIVTIAFPTYGSEVHETVIITISVTDAGGIDSVIIFIDGINLGEILEMDGVYKYYWETSAIEDSTTHIIIAKATDQAGNNGRSEQVVVTVNNQGYAPMPVILEKPEVDGAFITLRWSSSIDIDFNRYELLRSEEGENLFKIIFSDSLSHQVVFTDSVIQSTGYEYYMRVLDNAELFSESNHRIVEYGEFFPPVAENFYGEIRGGSIDLNWNPVNISDFGNYVILKSTTNLSMIDSIKITDMNASSYSDLVSQYNDYEYKLFVFDNFGNNSYSNPISFSSAEFQPQNQVLFDPIVEGFNVYLFWSLNNDLDFKYYEIYRSKNGSQMELIQQIDIQSDTSFVDFVSQDGSYDYLISVIDQAGLIANSNLVSIPSEVFFPNPVQLLSVNVDADTISLNWTQNNDFDFALYRIEQSTDGGDFTGILDIEDQTITSIVFNVIQYHDYIYRISCIDSASLESRSNILNVNKELFLPSQIQLESLTLSGDQILLKWNYTTDSDFLKFEIFRNDVIISEIFNSDIRRFIDIVSQGFDYTYRIKVIDKALLESNSTEKSIYSNEFYPPPIEIENISYSESGVVLEWIPELIPDFQSIEILRASDSLFSDQELIAAVRDQNQQKYVDLTVVNKNNRYFYKLKRIDSANLESISNWDYITFYHDIAFLGHYDTNNGRDIVFVESDGYNHFVRWSKDGISALNMAISPNAEYVFLYTDQGFELLNLKNGQTQFIKSLDINSCCYKMIWSKDNNYVYFYEESNNLYRYNRALNTVSVIAGDVQNFDYSMETDIVVYSKSVDRLGIVDFDIFIFDGTDHQNITNIIRDNEYNPKINYSGTKVYYNKDLGSVIMSIELSDYGISEIMPLSDWNINTMTFSNDDRMFMVGGRLSEITQGLYEIFDSNGSYILIYPNESAGYEWGQIDWSPDYTYFCFDKENSIIIIETENIDNVIEIEEASLNPPNLQYPKWVKNKWANE